MVEQALVAGGGPAGAAVAITLAKAGLKPLLIDREVGGKEKVCGCFLSVEAAAMMERLGIDLDRLGASRISRARLIKGKRIVETDLPFQARGLSRRVMDAALMDAARETGARIVTGTVTSITGNTAILRSGAELGTRALFLATGKHDVRGLARTNAPDNIGLKQMFNMSASQTAALDGVVELYLFEGGYAGLQLVEKGIANLCLVIDRDAFRHRGGTWELLIADLAREMPEFARRMAGGEALGAKPLAIAHIPYGFVFRHETDPGSELYRIGDQSAVIPSFSGDGMAIALHTGMAAARCHLSGGTAADFHRALEVRLKPQFRLAQGLDRLAQRSWGRSAIMALGGLSPALMRWAASKTRLAAAIS